MKQSFVFVLFCAFYSRGFLLLPLASGAPEPAPEPEVENSEMLVELGMDIKDEGREIKILKITKNVVLLC